MLMVGLPGVVSLPFSFMLKNKLHLTAQGMSLYGLVVTIPVYLSFLQGYARDVWNPLGRRDRGFMILFSFLAAGAGAIFAFVPVSVLSLGAAAIVISFLGLFISSAQIGLTAVVARQNVMSGQISALWNIVSSLPIIIAMLIGGSLSQALRPMDDQSEMRLLFLTSAALTAAIACFAFWRPAYVYDHVHAEHAPKLHLWADVKRFVRHWPVYPALLIWALWNFAPGSGVPLQYHMQDHLHGTDAQWGQWQAIFTVSFIPTFLLYGLLCRRLNLGWLIVIGTVIGVPQMVPLLFIHSATGALIAAAPIGLMGGLCSAAYYDLLIRSCPKGLEGTMLMFSTSLYWLITRAGDVLGSWLFERFHGFSVCVVAITIVYAAILPVLLLVPRRLLATPDGVAVPGGFDAG